MKSETLFSESNQATYSPEDNKLRLYVGRVPRDEYLALKAEGWTSTPKQGCDFVAHWTPERRDTAISYAGVITDEDQGPEERAADRAERFSGYLGKRMDEATGHADKYDAGPQVHGFQNYAKAVKAADRHDRSATHACDAWEKAEYWQRRTAGVISHALYVSSPAVRMGRIKVIEAELRKYTKARDEYATKYNRWLACSEMTDTPQQDALARKLAYVEHGDYIHPRTGRKSYLYDHAVIEEGRNDDALTGAELCALWLSRHSAPSDKQGAWETHYNLRLAYENQMLEAQGGRAAMVEMEAGGWLGKHQIRKVNKSPATGRVVSVEIAYMSETNQYGNPWSDGKGARMLPATINVERMGTDVYRAPTDEERAEYADKTKEAKKAKAAATKAKAEAGENCPLINPTDEDAQKLQDLWNEKALECNWYKRNDGKLSEVLRLTQAQYSAASGGTFSSAKTITVCEHGTKHERRSGDLITRADVFKVRAASNGYSADRVVIITDKPQKPLPWAKLEAARAKQPTVESLRPRFAELDAALRECWLPNERTEAGKLIADARYAGLVFVQSMSQFGWTDKGREVFKASQPVTA